MLPPHRDFEVETDWSVSMMPLSEMMEKTTSGLRPKDPMAANPALSHGSSRLQAGRMFDGRWKLFHGEVPFTRARWVRHHKSPLGRCECANTSRSFSALGGTFLQNWQLAGNPLPR